MKHGFDIRAVARRVVCVTLFALAPAAFGHYLWIERDGASARLYFGEVNEVREQSPGRLDDIVAPRLLAISADGAERELTVVRKRGSFALAGAPAAADLIATEGRYAVQDWTRHGIGIVKPMFYARTSAWPARAAPARSAAMRLDVRPVAGLPRAIEVVFDGKPLAGAKVVVHAPNGWDQEHKTNEKGQAHVAMPWRGQYVFEVIHKEAVPGEFEGKRYDATRHRATLTVSQRSGISPAGTGGLAPKVAD